MPSSFECTYFPVNGGSVPCRRITSYSSGVSCWAHSSSVFSTFASIQPRLPEGYARHLAEGLEQLLGNRLDGELSLALRTSRLAHPRALLHARPQHALERSRKLVHAARP